MDNPSSQRMVITSVAKRAQAATIEAIGIGNEDMINERSIKIQSINAVRWASSFGPGIDTKEWGSEVFRKSAVSSSLRVG